MVWLLVAFLVLTAGREQGQNPCRGSDEWVCTETHYLRGTLKKCVIYGTRCAYSVWTPAEYQEGTSRGGGDIPDKPRVAPTWTVVKALYR